MHTEGLVLPELDLGRFDAEAAPIVWTRNIVIVAVNRGKLSDARIERLTR